MEEIFSLNNNLLIHNDVSLNGNLNVKNIITQDLSVNNILKTNNLDVYGNLTVFGNQTIINSEVLNVDDNIIIVNADGRIIQEAGIQANINGNLYGFLYDNNINAWTINNKNLHLNKLVGNNIELSENVTAQWFNGNLSGTNATLTESLRANTIHVNELHLGPNTLYIDNEAILYKHNGNLLMNVNHLHGDLIGNLISKNTFVNGNIIIGNNFGIKFHDGTTITTGNISSTAGGGGTSNVTPEEIDERISNYLFNKPEAPTDSSHNFQIITSNDGTHPTITLLWSNPTTKRVAFPFGTTPGYNNPSNNNPLLLDRSNFNSNKNITHLPYSKELKIEFHEENTPSTWSNLTLHSDGIGNTQHIIPNSVITANLNSSNNTPTLLANTVSNTYTEFKSGKGLTIGNKYQFRIYLTNEITEEDSSYNYLYIPSETEYIPFGGFANVTAPTEILFPENDVYNLQIKGINSNPYAETGMNTTFPIPDNFDLRVRYGFNIDISANVNSKQIPNERRNSNSGFFITENLRNSNFTVDIDFDSGLQLQNGDYISWYPEFDYNVSNFFMEANLDISGNIGQTTIGNTIRTLMPRRDQVNAATIFFDDLSQNDYTSEFSSNNFGMTKSNIYSYNNNNRIDNIYILDSTESFDLTFNPNIIVINNSNDYIGIDTSGVDLSNFTSNIVNYDITERFNDETNYSKGFLQITNINSTANIIITGAIEDNSIYNITKGYYTDIELSQIGVNNINLSRFPDICNNNYQKYRVNVNQNVNFSNDFENKGTIYFDFGVAEKSASDITLTISSIDPLSPSLNNNYFGIKRPDYSTNINRLVILSLDNVNRFWRANTKIINIFRLSYNTTQLSNIEENKKSWTEPNNSDVISLDFYQIIKPTDFWYNISNPSLLYSRNSPQSPQLTLSYEINNNIGRDSSTISNSYDTGFYDSGNSNKVLWWDYTWGINNGPPSSFFSTTSSTVISTIQFINAVGNNTFSSNITFDHVTILADNQLMWANGGFRSGGITESDNNNPYIDYTNFYNPSSVLSNYESKRTSGDIINFNFSNSPIYNRNWYNSTIDTTTTPISRTFKFITFNIKMPYLDEIGSNSSLDANGPAFGIRIKNISQNIIQKDTLDAIPSTNSGYVLFHNEYRSNIQEDKIDGNKTFSSTIPSTAIKSSYRTTINNYNYYHIFNVSSNSSSISGAEKTTLQISIGIDNNINDSIEEISISFLKN